MAATGVGLTRARLRGRPGDHLLRALVIAVVVIGLTLPGDGLADSWSGPVAQH